MMTTACQKTKHQISGRLRPIVKIIWNDLSGKNGLIMKKAADLAASLKTSVPKDRKECRKTSCISNKTMWISNIFMIVTYGYSVETTWSGQSHTSIENEAVIPYLPLTYSASLWYASVCRFLQECSMLKVFSAFHLLVHSCHLCSSLDLPHLQSLDGSQFLL